MLFVQQFLQTLLIEVAGVSCTAAVLYLNWNTITKKSKEAV